MSKTLRAMPGIIITQKMLAVILFTLIITIGNCCHIFISGGGSGERGRDSDLFATLESSTEPARHIISIQLLFVE